MKIAILTRPGDCFPNIISQGLSDMLNQLGVEHKLFYDAIPLLMRLLPLGEKPKRWANSLHFRVYNKIKHLRQDKQLLEELRSYDLIILSECLPNALWKNYLAIEEFKRKVRVAVGSYSDGSMEIAPIHRRMVLDQDDADESRFDFNLFVSDIIELRKKDYPDNQRVIGLDLQYTGLSPRKREEFIAVVDFAQEGYEAYREQQLRVLNALGIKTIELEGRYPMSEIRNIYQQASGFFMAFPETFGLPIAECLASGTLILTPDSGWPMAWRLDKAPMPWGGGQLPDCFRVYKDDDELATLLTGIRKEYDLVETPKKVFQTFLQHYPRLYGGDKDALKEMLERFAAAKTKSTP